MSPRQGVTGTNYLSSFCDWLNNTVGRIRLRIVERKMAIRLRLGDVVILYMYVFMIERVRAF